ncbi:MAG: hypothetical protein AB7I25_00460 [Vicinamibacterales bacterium]
MSATARLNPSLHSTMARLVGPVIWLAASLAVAAAASAEPLPVAQQNAVVEKHCAVCHTDRTPNGGLSLQGFDAASVTPGLAAMMLSKLTSGLPLAAIAKAATDETARGHLTKRIYGGAIMAAGIAPPEPGVSLALTAALAERAAGATSWHLSQVGGATTAPRHTTVSIVREVPREADVVESYRLLLTCDGATGRGQMQVAWSPVATTGVLATVVDGTPHGRHAVEGREAMGNGSGTGKGLAAVSLPSLALPMRSFLVRDLFPGEQVDFPFADLPPAARRALEPCAVRR